MSRKDEVWLGNQINWNHIFYFSEVAQYSSLKEASKFLRMSPSTLSEHVSQLEQMLGVKLFRRGHRQLTLTPKGSELYRYAKSIFELGFRVVNRVAPVALGAYPITVGLVPSFSLPAAYRLVRSFLRGHRNLNFKLQHFAHEELEKALGESRVDFGFTDRVPEVEGIEHRVVSHSVLSFYVSAEIAADRTLSECLDELPLLACSFEAGGRESLDGLLDELGIIPRTVIISDYPGLVLELCGSGDGVAILSEETAQSRYNSGFLPLSPPRKSPRIREKMLAVWRRDAEESEVIRHLCSVLESEGQFNFSSVKSGT